VVVGFVVVTVLCLLLKLEHDEIRGCLRLSRGYPTLGRENCCGIKVKAWDHREVQHHDSSRPTYL
jgi:hypothetical protein